MSRMRWSDPDDPRALPAGGAHRAARVRAAATPPLRIGYVPFGGITNKYAERFVEILGAFGTVAELPGPRAALRRPWHPPGRYDLAVLNWIELDLVRRSDGAFSTAGFLKVLARLLFFRCMARRVVYVRHNNFPHGTRESDIPRARRAVDLLERLCDVVLTHSGHDLAGRRRYVPHPLYWPAKARLDAAEQALLADLPVDFYAVFGRIEPYKRIDRLIAHFPPTRNLVVFGAAEDAEHVGALRGMAGPNVRLLPGYVSEALAQAVIRRSRGLILSHAERDMIVSGSLFYALSIGTRVFALESPGLAWIRQRIGAGPMELAPDIPALCALIARDEESVRATPAGGRRPDWAGWWPVVAEEFGDARIKAVLREALFP